MGLGEGHSGIAEMTASSGQCSLTAWPSGMMLSAIPHTMEPALSEEAADRGL